MRRVLIDEQLEQALEVSEQDVKDASAAVLQDLKRFQQDKEDDFRRYMVSLARAACQHISRLTESRCPTHDATSTGRGRIWRHGQKQRTKWTRSKSAEIGNPFLVLLLL